MSITATQPESIGDPLWCVSWKSELSVASVCFTYTRDRQIWFSSISESVRLSDD
ncbi:hypothetical protein ACD631_14680 [Alteromonas macleodii]|uniref:hypothetical protein n=1 Tax=Alteromonas macleodii TaxID=28108 RepID=UPI0020768168|nr:hypothetical protein [Alteromonas macleodii]USI27604.1 hypothetical protein NFG60_18140 [Alteromonas macleodii]